jgi:cation transport regulator ChaC
MAGDQWIFGYGSLVWRPAFPYLEREPGFIMGFSRRFWQASPDHRGTPERPGRVVTLVEDPGAVCWGMGYRVAGEHVPEVLEALDYREQAGYQRFETRLDLRDHPTPVPGALLYVAAPGNPNFIGDTPLDQIAAIARVAEGPSGPNREYVLRLDSSLIEMGGRDEHVSALARMIAGG